MGIGERERGTEERGTEGTGERDRRNRREGDMNIGERETDRRRGHDLWDRHRRGYWRDTVHFWDLGPIHSRFSAILPGSYVWWELIVMYFRNHKFLR